MIKVGAGAVNSVNGKTGNVVLTTSDLANDSDYQTGTDVEGSISTAVGAEATLRQNADEGLQTQINNKQNKLTAGDNIQISGNEISATDTTYNDFTGTDGSSAGQAGLVPAPTTSDAGKYLKANGTWDSVNAGPTVVQTTGQSTTDVMSQKAVTDIVGDVEAALNVINNGGSI